MRKLALIAALAATALFATACGGDDHAAHEPAAADEHMMEGEVPGGPADPAEATKEIKVLASDTLEFEPASIEVAAGEVITFIVENPGSAHHEFVLGDAAYQEMHGGEDHDMGHMDNAVDLPPGETAELTWRFDEAGEVLFGCHEPGHYDGGMVGTITVTN